MAINEEEVEGEFDATMAKAAEDGMEPLAAAKALFVAEALARRKTAAHAEAEASSRGRLESKLAVFETRERR